MRRDEFAYAAPNGDMIINDEDLKIVLHVLVDLALPGAFPT
jgi:hypothetical protein